LYTDPQFQGMTFAVSLAALDSPDPTPLRHGGDRELEAFWPVSIMAQASEWIPDDADVVRD
jgi:hypothetical protein